MKTVDPNFFSILSSNNVEPDQSLNQSDDNENSSIRERIRIYEFDSSSVNTLPIDYAFQDISTNGDLIEIACSEKQILERLIINQGKEQDKISEIMKAHPTIFILKMPDMYKVCEVSYPADNTDQKGCHIVFYDIEEIFVEKGDHLGVFD
jgi:hypothetical protein